MRVVDQVSGFSFRIPLGIPETGGLGDGDFFLMGARHSLKNFPWLWLKYFFHKVKLRSTQKKKSYLKIIAIDKRRKTIL